MRGKGEWGDMGHMRLAPARHLAMPRLDILVMPWLSQGPISAIHLDETDTYQIRKGPYTGDRI